MTDNHSRRALRILVVDDDDLVRRATVRHLLRAGHNVVAVATSHDALGLEGTFDVAVLDLELGARSAMSGIELGGALLACLMTRRILFFSATFDRDRVLLASRVGVVIDKGAPDAIAILLAVLSRDE